MFLILFLNLNEILNYSYCPNMKFAYQTQKHGLLKDIFEMVEYPAGSILYGFSFVLNYFLS